MIWRIIILLILASDLSSQTITVIDSEVGDPLYNARITTLPSGRFYLTDSEGRVELQKGADSLLVVEYFGYTTAEFSIGSITDTIYLDPLNEIFESVVVTGEEFNSAYKRSSRAVHQLTLEQVLVNPPASTGDLLRNVPGVYIQESQAAGGSPMIRGMSANRILSVIDGIRLNNAILRGGNVQQTLSVDPYALSDANVIFGSGSLGYGSDALGGVIEYQTISIPKKGWKGNILLTGNYPSAFGSIHADAGYRKNKIGFLTSISYSQQDHLVMGGNGPVEFLRNWYVNPSTDHVIINEEPEVQYYSDLSRINFLTKFLFEPVPGHSFTLAFHNNSTSDNNRYDRLVLGTEEEPQYSEWYYGPQNWKMLHLQYKTTYGSWYDNININLAGQSYEESRYTRRFKSSALRKRFEDVNVYILSADWGKNLQEGWFLSGGIDMAWNVVGSQAHIQIMDPLSFEPLSTRYPDGSKWNDMGIYLLSRYNISPEFFITGGIRYNRYDIYAELDTTYYKFSNNIINEEGGAMSFQTGVGWNIHPHLLLKANLSTGFRAPNIDDMGKLFDSEPGAVVVPNPALDPEYAWHSDIDILYSWSNTGRLDLQLFGIYLDKAIIRAPFTIEGRDSIIYDGALSEVLALQNGGESIIYGISLQVQEEILSLLFVEAEGTWQDGHEIINGMKMPVRHIPPAFASATLEYRDQDWKVGVKYRINLGYDFSELAPSERGKLHLYAINNDGEPYYPSWQTVDVFGLWDLKKTLTISGGVENLLNKRYKFYSSGISARGRTYYLGVHYSF